MKFLRTVARIAKAGAQTGIGIAGAEQPPGASGWQTSLIGLAVMGYAVYLLQAGHADVAYGLLIVSLGFLRSADIGALLPRLKTPEDDSK